MKPSLKLSAYLIIICILFSSCAAHYRAINPNILVYHGHNKSGEISCSYKYNVLMERGNKRYSKKEFKRGIKLLAIKITNSSNKEIVVKDDLVFTANNEQVFPLEPTVVKQYLGQKAGFHLFYLLLTFISINTYDAHGNIESSFPIGLILGPGIAFGNLIGATQANKNFVEEYSRESIINKTISPGETVSGLMAIRATGEPVISVIQARY